MSPYTLTTCLFTLLVYIVSAAPLLPLVFYLSLFLEIHRLDRVCTAIEYAALLLLSLLGHIAVLRT